MFLKKVFRFFFFFHYLNLKMLSALCMSEQLFAVWFYLPWCIFQAGTMKGRSLGVLCSLCLPILPVHRSARSFQLAKLPPSRPSSSYFGHSAQLRVTRDEASQYLSHESGLIKTTAKLWSWQVEVLFGKRLTLWTFVWLTAIIPKNRRTSSPKSVTHKSTALGKVTWEQLLVMCVTWRRTSRCCQA